MPLLPGQFSFRGLTFGEGTDYHINRAEGFEGFEARTSDSDQPRGDGGIRGLDYVAPRTIAFELALAELEDLDGSIYEGRWGDVRAAFRPARNVDYDLTFKRDGASPERVIRCRPIQLTRGEDYLRFNRVGTVPLVLRAVDPRIYSVSARSGNVPLYAANSGGLDVPVSDFPLDFAGGMQTELVVENAGTAEAFPLVRFYGPVTGTCTRVTLTNSTTGQVFDVTTTIGSGQILTADMEAAVTGANRLIVALGGSSRYGSWALPRAPLALAPGSNLLRFQATGTSTDVICSITHRDTWLD